MKEKRKKLIVESIAEKLNIKFRITYRGGDLFTSLFIIISLLHENQKTAAK